MCILFYILLELGNYLGEVETSFVFIALSNPELSIDWLNLPPI